MKLLKNLFTFEKCELGYYVVDKNGKVIFSTPSIKAFLCRRDIILARNTVTGNRSLWVWNRRLNDYYEISLRGFGHFFRDLCDYFDYVMA